MLPDDSPIRAVLIDIAGVLHERNRPVPGSPEAVAKLKATGRQIRYLTNTTRMPRELLVAKLRNFGFDISVEQVHSAPVATRHFLQQRSLVPYFVVHPDLESEFREFSTDVPDTVCVGDAGPNFCYEAMNAAFRVLVESGGPLIAMGENSYFRDSDSQLSLDMWGFVLALKDSAEKARNDRIETIVTGKPSRQFFEEALDEMGLSAGDTVMIGDDLLNDIGGAQNAGIPGILVRTGKYQRKDEFDLHVTPHLVVDDVCQAIVICFSGKWDFLSCV